MSESFAPVAPEDLPPFWRENMSQKRPTSSLRVFGWIVRAVRDEVPADDQPMTRKEFRAQMNKIAQRCLRSTQLLAGDPPMPDKQDAALVPMLVDLGLVEKPKKRAMGRPKKVVPPRTELTAEERAQRRQMVEAGMLSDGQTAA